MKKNLIVIFNVIIFLLIAFSALASVNLLVNSYLQYSQTQNVKSCVDILPSIQSIVSNNFERTFLLAFLEIFTYFMYKYKKKKGIIFSIIVQLCSVVYLETIIDDVSIICIICMILLFINDSLYMTLNENK